MSDPRFTDPRNSDPRLSDPVLRREDDSGGIWGWVAGLAVLALIAFIVVAGWNNGGNNQASTSNTAPITTGSNAPRMSPPSTTGSGTTSPQPAMPAAPAPSPAPKPQQ
jgi:hypothetical protein